MISNMDEDIMLSIYVATYNHEKYIGMALDSILMQKTKHKFEVLVGEDCSTDKTREVLQQYERKYPGFFTIFYRDHNMHSEKPNNAGDLKRRCRGKYIIALEGDDYWTDENKIEQQIDFLENHPEYIGAAHNCVVVDENSNPNGEEYPECKDEEYTLKHFISEIMPGQLTTLMYRNYRRDNMMDSSIFDKKITPGDRVSIFALTVNGRIYCQQKVMSAYRHITGHGTSFSANYKYSFDKDEKYTNELYCYAVKNGDEETLKIVSSLYVRSLMNGIKSRQCSFREMLKYLNKIDNKYIALYSYFKQWVNHHILRKKIWI